MDASLGKFGRSIDGVS